MIEAKVDVAERLLSQTIKAFREIEGITASQPSVLRIWRR